MEEHSRLCTTYMQAGLAIAPLTESEVLAGASDDSDTITLPDETGSSVHVRYGALMMTAAILTEVHVSGGGNSRNLFGAAAALTVDSVAGQLIVSVGTFNATLLSGEDVRLV